MFKVKVYMKVIGDFPTFVEAFQKFFPECVRLLEAGMQSYVFEQTNFIEHTTGSGTRCVMNFYQARDFAYDIGLLAGEGELQNIPEPSRDVVDAAFLGANVEHMGALKRELDSALNQLAK